MKNLSLLFLIIFVTFLCTPTIVTYVDKKIDVSMAFTANEEENSSKTSIGFEYTLQDANPYNTGIHFFQEQTLFNHFYKEGSGLVFLDVLSPPPKQV